MMERFHLTQGRISRAQGCRPESPLVIGGPKKKEEIAQLQMLGKKSAHEAGTHRMDRE